jgi:ABC-type microcin C transport system permease subunit YejB
LSANDPVRVFQQFATIDLLPRGRAEMIVGRGSFIEAFPLFGLNRSDYDSLFASKLELLLKSEDFLWHLMEREVVTLPIPSSVMSPMWTLDDGVRTTLSSLESIRSSSR